MNSGFSIDWLLANGNLALEIIGTLAFAASGLIEAARKRLDIVGMAMVTALAAFGGGTLRDILLDRRPFFWVQNQIWIWVLLIAVIFALAFMRRRHVELTERATAWPDALGLGVFAAGGTQIALSAHVPAIVAVIMGIITAVFGGVLRDIAVNEIPRAFIDHQPYTVVAFVGGWVVVALDYFGASSFVAVGLGSSVIVILRILVMLKGWRLPSWRV